MKFMLLIYTDPALMAELDPERTDELLRECFDHVDALRRQGIVLESQMLAPAATATFTARSPEFRVRSSRTV